MNRILVMMVLFKGTAGRVRKAYALMTVRGVLCEDG